MLIVTKTVEWSQPGATGWIMAWEYGNAATFTLETRVRLDQVQTQTEDPRGKGSIQVRSLAVGL